ncbi:MAG: Mini-ribonuclease 3 [Lactobacillaceae bacterium]|jgi:ribonuclease-3 family protein|nr:Mini-ribonuclease 3 [Lactobacillaceae bacterium]
MEFNYQQLNGLTLAYVGDAVYESAIRVHLVKQGITKVNILQKMSKEFVSAKAHARLFKLMQESSILTETEIDIYKRGRNSHPHTKAKNTDIVTYQISTGVESLLGYLFLSNDLKRLNQLIDWMIKQVESGETRNER